MKNLLVLAIIASCIIACKSKKDSPGFISALSIIKKDIAAVDTSLFSIVQFTTVDSAHTDTSYIHREDFNTLAADFLSIPDIAAKKYSGRYTEQNRLDGLLGKVFLTYLPVNPSKEIIQRQDFVVTPDPSGGESTINSIIIECFHQSKDSALRKRLLWQVNKSFQIVDILQKPGGFQSTTTRNVIWNDDSELK